MIKIAYSKPSQEVDFIKEKLTSLSLAYSEEGHKDHEIALHENEEIYIGKESIEKYLEQLEGELAKWHYCNC